MKIRLRYCLIFLLTFSLFMILYNLKEEEEMIMNRSELKRKAKESLKGKYFESTKLFLLYIVICFVMSFILAFFNNIIELDSISFILGFAVIFSIYGFYAGFYSFFLKISRNENVNCNELFKCMNLFWISIGVTLLASLFSFVGMLLFIIPGIIIALNYALVYFVIVENPEIGVMDALTKSKQIIKGHRIDFVILNFSFLGWYILSYFTFGILLIWVAPYIMVTTANFYNEIIEKA